MHTHDEYTPISDSQIDTNDDRQPNRHDSRVDTNDDSPIDARALYKRPHSAKATYNFKEPTNRSHPIATFGYG